MTRLEIWLLGVLGAIALAGACYFYGHRDGATAERQSQQHLVDEANARAKASDDRYAAGVSGRDEQLAAIAARLAAPPPNPQILIKQVAPDATGNCTDRSTDFRVLYNAAAGTSGPTAAAAALPDTARDRAGLPPP